MGLATLAHVLLQPKPSFSSRAILALWLEFLEDELWPLKRFMVHVSTCVYRYTHIHMYIYIYIHTHIHSYARTLLPCCSRIYGQRTNDYWCCIIVATKLLLVLYLLGILLSLVLYYYLGVRSTQSNSTYMLCFGVRGHSLGHFGGQGLVVIMIITIIIIVVITIVSGSPVTCIIG